jgi:hypothetical protein
MYSYFLRRCIHRQSAISNNAPTRKKEPCNWWTSPLCIQMCSSSLKPMQILWMLYHGGNLKFWCDIGHFFVWWGHIETSPNNTTMGIVKIWWQPWTSPQQWWIHQFFITCAHVNHPNFSTQHRHPKPSKWGRATNTCHAAFLSKVVPWVKILIEVIRLGQRLVGSHSCPL